jgi:Ca2+-binding RTX toxin-like protein
VNTATISLLPSQPQPQITAISTTLFSVAPLAGGDGDDMLIGGPGPHAFNGGAGVDTANYSASDAGLTINLATGGASGGDAWRDTFTSIENLIGSAHADILAGNAGNNALRGEAGSDKLAGGAGSDVLFGGDGNDILRGGAGDRRRQQQRRQGRS